MALGICIANDNRTNASYLTLSKRVLVKYSSNILSLLSIFTGVAVFNTIGSLASLVVIIGFLFIFAQAKKGFHDMFANTAVYHKDELISQEQAEKIKQAN